MIKKCEILVFVGLFVYIVLIFLAASQMMGCTLQKSDPKQAFNCVFYGTVDKAPIYRCEDEIAVCYLRHDRLSCIKKSRFDKPSKKEHADKD